MRGKSDRMPSFAVVIPTKNRSQQVSEVVERVRTLAGSPEEIVVVDDNSTDDTIEQLSGLSFLTLVNGDGAGPAAARNLGVAASSADWLVFLDDDDEPDAEWMLAFRELVAEHPDAEHVSVGYRYRSATGSVVRAPQPLGSAFADAVSSYLAGTFAVRRSLFDDVGGFDGRLRHMEFTSLALRLFERCAGRPGALAMDPRPRITYVGRPSSTRESQNPHVLANSAVLVLEQSAHRWRRDPKEYANQLATVGVAMVRAGRGSDGRRMLWRAAAHDPSSLAHVGRATLALLPPVRRRVWSRHVDSRTDSEPLSNDGPLVSVIIPSYGRQDLLDEAVHSVLAQSYAHIELIVVDDGSPDPLSVPIDPRVRLIRQPNRGAGVARNAGATAAEGEILFFLDSDDVFTSSRIANAVAAHQETLADIVVCGQSWLDGSGPLRHDLFGFVGDRILDGITPHVGATSIRRSRFIPFDERYLASQDVEWWLRIARDHTLMSIDPVDCRIRRHPQQRHLNGPAARLEFGYQLLDERAEYFFSHPRARSFRLARLARVALTLDDHDAALRLGVAACRVRLGRASLGALLRSASKRARDLTRRDPRLPQVHRVPLAARHIREWRPRVYGPPEARIVPTDRPSRVAVEIGAHLRRPWSGYVRAIGVRMGHSREVEVHGAFGRLCTSRHDHTLLHPYFFETFESAVIARLLRPGMHVVDIGANRGWYTMMAAALVGETGRVLAVEPDERMRSALRRSLEVNGLSGLVVVDSRAVSDVVGTHGWVASAEGSLAHLVGHDEGVAVIEVATVTLDRLLDEHGITVPGFIKIDVEGAEARVLRSCRFDRFDELPDIMFEFQPEMIERSGEVPDDLLGLLWAAGYRILQLRAGEGRIVEVESGSALPDPAAGRNLLAVASGRVEERLSTVLISPLDAQHG